MRPAFLAQVFRTSAFKSIALLSVLLIQTVAHGALSDIIGGNGSGCGVTMSCAPDSGSGGSGNTPGTGTGTSTSPVIGSCALNPNGNTCGAAQATASQGGNGGLDVGVKNPINLISGNKYQQEGDLPALPGTLGIEIIRHYNSQSRDVGQLGWNWKLSYETDLYPGPSALQILQADGRRIIFSRDPKNPSLCQSANPADGRIDIKKNARGQEEFIWTWNNGKKLSFNAQGKLDAITADGQVLTIQRGPKGEIVKVTDPQNRSLVMRYGTDQNGWRGIIAIESPVGRFQYAQALDGKGVGNLVQVKYPGGAVSRTYHYSATEQQARHEADKAGNAKEITYVHPNPHLLTGISVQGTGSDGKSMSQRISTYGYDLNGRAILTTHADNVDKAALDYSEGGKTIVTNSLGQKTAYLYAVIGGEYRLLEAIGAGCTQCSETNVRYSWNRNGQLVMRTKLTDDRDAKPIASTRYDYDTEGRIVRQHRRTYDAKNGKPTGPWQWMQRYEYVGNQHQPTLIGRPSVVPGLELLTRIAYGDTEATRQLPFRITESGYIPTMDGKSAAGEIVRTMAYRYNSEGRRIETDGPLQNAKENAGPDNSDITRTEYDSKTKLVTRTVAPGNIVTEVIERDDALRPVKVRTNDGYSVQTATIRSNWRGQPEEISIEAARFSQSQDHGASDRPIAADSKMIRTLRYRYDANGRLISVTLPGNLTTQFKYDVGGRLTHRILPDGSAVVMKQDTEGRTQTISGYADSSATVGAAIMTVRYQYDDWNRVTRIDDAQGMRSGYRYTDTGQIAAITNALGTATQFDYDANGLLIARVQAANSPDAAITKLSYDSHGQPIVVTDANGVTTQQRYDDFGRKIAEVNPDRGITLYRYDVAGRPIAKIDETQTTTRYTYDHANRLIALGADKQPNLVQYRYLGMRLVDVVSTIDGDPGHATERTQYQHNALGQVTQETRWIARVDALPQPVAQPGVALAATAPPLNTARPMPPLRGLTFTTKTAYDDAGRLIKQILPDGHELAYRYTAAGDGSSNVASVATARPGQLNAILFDDRVIVADIEQTQAGGLTGYTAGNGVQQRIKLDASGRIEQLQAVAQPAGLHGDWWRKIKAWFAIEQRENDTTIYAQINRYDVVGRLVSINRTHARIPREQSARTASEHYGYDGQDRLTEMQAADGTITRVRYDKGGNRIAEQVTSNQGGSMRTAVTEGQSVARERLYRYADRTNRLVAIIEGGQSSPRSAATREVAAPKTAEQAAQLVRTAWLYHDTGVPLAGFAFAQGRLDRNASNRIVYNSGKRPIAVYDSDNQLIARYYYNGRGERTAKTVYANRSVILKVADETSKKSDPGTTSYSLYRDQRLAAETDDEGRITTHYVYLQGKPVAKIEMTPNTGASHTIWKAIATLGGTMKQSEADADDSKAVVYAIHTDHLGTPQAVTDEHQRVVWQAQTTPFGQAKVIYAAASASKPDEKFEMNLRLPGQVYDRETDLHYNYYRDYDSAVGRYTTPDPMGLSSGMNPYTYVSDDPLSKTDRLGLYEEDVHYYLTYFLALTAGLQEREAWIIAMGNRYIDDNTYTEPFGSTAGLPLNFDARKFYHFTQDGYDPIATKDEVTIDPKTLLVTYSEKYTLRRFERPDNPQLRQLHAYAMNAPTSCAKAQFYGEYLHAFEDTFAHRDEANVPYGYKTGHLSGGHEPDHTYNAPFWKYNQDRTFEMEKEVFAKFKEDFRRTATNASTGSQITIAVLEATLTKFNRDTSPEKPGLFASTKISILQQKLRELGLPEMSEYDKKIAAKCRTANLKDATGRALVQDNYRNAILKTDNADANKDAKCEQ